MVNTTGVIGADTMGNGIAQVCAAAGRKVDVMLRRRQTAEWGPEWRYL
jgi:3-hydroxyacyl-CoA dehydrogenase